MQQRLLNLSQLNINGQIMEIPLQEGGVEDDNYFGSIGDATMQHVSSLKDGDRQLWESLYRSGAGGIFRFEPSNAYFDRDPHNLRGKDLDEWKKNYIKTHYEDEISEEDEKWINLAIDEEIARREESDCVYDTDEMVFVPYDEWEKFPQMWNTWDIPSTPRDKMIYMGNTKDMFYDVIPTGHPDEQVILQCIQILNQDVDRLNNNYAEFVHEWIEVQPCQLYVTKILKKLASRVCHDRSDIWLNAEEEIECALLAIDSIWQKNYISYWIATHNREPMATLFNEKDANWEKQVENGINVFNQVKTFGSMLYDNFRDQMRYSHWLKYRALKTKYSPRVMLNGVDLNRADFSELHKVLKLKSKGESIRVKEARPFSSLGQVKSKGFISAKTYATGAKTDWILKEMEEIQTRGREEKELKKFSDFQRKIIAIQRKNPDDESWSSVWAYYRVLKQELQYEIQSHIRKLEKSKV